MKEDVKKSELIEHILQLSAETVRGLAPLVSHDWLQLDLTMPQLKVMFILFTSSSARMGVIASALGVNLGTATGVVDRLVERGLVLRESQPGDRRVVLCSLSEKGQELIGRLWQISQVQQRNVLEAMELSQLQSLNDSLEVVLQAERSAKETLKRFKKDGNNQQIEESAAEVVIPQVAT